MPATRDPPQAMPGHLVVVGVNHRTSTVSLRDRLFVNDAATPEFLARLRESGIAQALVLSTCDRVEVQAIHDSPAAAATAVTDALAARARHDLADIAEQFYRFEGEAALTHIFAVAASLDSQVIGEPQILGQVKASYRLARDLGGTGAELDGVLRAAFVSAKRVRRETAIAEGPVSIAAAAGQLARDVHGDLTHATAMVLGGGAEMGEMIVEHLLSLGLGRVLATAPAVRRAEALARRLDCHLVPFDGFAVGLAEADIVIASVGTRRYLIDGEMIASALRRRRGRPIFLVDAAIPGDVAPEVNRMEEVFLYDLGELEQVALDGRATREAAAAAAWEIVGAEVASFLRGHAERRAAPAVTQLRDHVEALRRRVLSETDGDAERATRLLVRRLLHTPSAVLREIAAEAPSDARESVERLVRRLFGLSEPSADDTEQAVADDPPIRRKDA